MSPTFAPRVAFPARPVSAPPPKSTAEVCGQILVIDDDPTHCRLVRRLLEREGHAIQVAHDTERAHEALRGALPDLILLDLHLEGASGLDILADVRARSRHVPVAVLTGDPSVPRVVEAMRAGASDYLLKPLEPLALRRAVQRHLETPEETEASGSAPTHPHADDLAGPSAAIQRLHARIRQLAPHNLPVVVLGERGSGKSAVARRLHAQGPRSGGPFVRVACDALHGTAGLASMLGVAAESPAFGPARPGAIEAANGGTLYLHHADAMSDELQAAVLQLLEDNSVTPIGAPSRSRADVQVIVSPTGASLYGSGLRADLCDALSVAVLEVPPLRRRRADLPVLIGHYFQLICQRHGWPAPHLTPEAVAALQAHPWRGNLRELKAVLSASLLELEAQPPGSGSLETAVQAVLEAREAVVRGGSHE